MALDPREIFSAGRLLARSKAPYLRSMIVGFAVVEAEGLGTIGVTEHGVLLVDFEFIAQVTPEEMAGLFVHECLHVCLEHHKRTKRSGRDPEIDNIAGDLAINPAVLEMGLKLPGGDNAGCFPESKSFPKEEGFLRGLTADEYYGLLKKRQQKGAPKPKTGGGWCGSCAGRAVPGEPGAQNKASRTETELARMTRTVAEEIRAAGSGSGMGNIPSFLGRWADDFFKPAEVPWQQKLGQTIRGEMATCMGAVDHRYNGPSRRQAGLGYGMGRAILPRLAGPRPEVYVIIDTSGSMGSTDLGTAASETNGIIRAAGGQVTVCTIDAAVSGLKKVRTIQQAVAMLKGGGGTDMRPGFALAAKMKPKPSLIVCITDGGIPHPGPQPKGCKVIWVVVGAHGCTAAIEAAGWGEIIVVPPDAGKARSVA